MRYHAVYGRFALEKYTEGEPVVEAAADEAEDAACDGAKGDAAVAKSAKSMDVS